MAGFSMLIYLASSRTTAFSGSATVVFGSSAWRRYTFLTLRSLHFRSLLLLLLALLLLLLSLLLTLLILLVLLLLTLYPQITLWLPDLMYGKAVP